MCSRFWRHNLGYIGLWPPHRHLKKFLPNVQNEGAAASRISCRLLEVAPWQVFLKSVRRRRQISDELLLFDRAHICHIYHKLYCGEKIVMWRNVGNFGKLWRYFGKFWEILGNFGRFCHNLRAFMWRKIESKTFVEKKWQIWGRRKLPREGRYLEIPPLRTKRFAKAGTFNPEA